MQIYTLLYSTLVYISERCIMILLDYLTGESRFFKLGHLQQVIE